MENQVKQIPIDGTPFQANGKTYYLENDLSIDRWIKMQSLQIELGFGVEFEEMQRNWKSILEMAQKSRFADIVIMAHNTVNGISKAYSREPMILKFCALFFNVEGEDTGIITDSMITAKIEDWKAEGLGIDGFFVFSLGKVNGFAESFKNAIQGGSDLDSADQ